MILETATRIGDRLLARALCEKNGLYWESTHFISKEEFGTQLCEDLYAGNSGINLFFQELGRQTGEARFQQAARDNLNWILAFCKTHEAATLSGLTGRYSVIFPLLRMAGLTGEAQWTEQALSLALSLSERVLQEQMLNELINGRASILLVCLHLHAATRSDEVLDLLDRLAGRIIDEAVPGPEGLCWDSNPGQLRALCGFSHGASGIGFAFGELARYLGNPGLQWVADQAFAYEDYWFEKLENWPDFRRGIYTDQDREEQLAALHRGDRDYFLGDRFMFAWCHGAPGLALARARSFELTGEQIMAHMFEQALALTREVEERPHPKGYNFTLCHGNCGNREGFLEAWRLKGDEAAREFAAALVEPIIEHLDQDKPLESGFPGLVYDDPSLFMGNAGIGYYLLRLADPETPSVMAPRLEAVADPVPDLFSRPTLALTAEGLRHRVLGHTFPRTWRYLAHLGQSPVRTRSDDLNNLSLADLVEARVSELEERQASLLSGLWALEWKRHELDRDTPSIALLQVQLIDHLQVLGSTPNPGDPDQRFILHPQAALVITEWDFSVDPTSLADTEPEQTAFLLARTPEAMIEETLTDFSALVLAAFSEGASIGTVIEQVTQAFEIGSDEERNAVVNAVMQQIGAALQSGILLFDSPYATIATST